MQYAITTWHDTCYARFLITRKTADPARMCTVATSPQCGATLLQSRHTPKPPNLLSPYSTTNLIVAHDLLLLPVPARETTGSERQDGRLDSTDRSLTRSERSDPQILNSTATPQTGRKAGSTAVTCKVST